MKFSEAIEDILKRRNMSKLDLNSLMNNRSNSQIYTVLKVGNPTLRMMQKICAHIGGVYVALVDKTGTYIIDSGKADGYKKARYVIIDEFAGKTDETN